MEKNKKIKMTQEGYNEQLQILESLKEKFLLNEKAMTKSYHNSSGDGAHDNAEFEELLGKERMLVKQIEDQKEKIKSIEIISVEILDDDIVNIGDTVSLNMIFDVDDTEEMTLTLVGADGKVDQNKISINSPLGTALYKKKVGETVPYKVNENNFYVEILEKVNTKEQQHVKTI